MEECCSKRKKRKTRKCLNEIRKKSRMNTNSASGIKNIELGPKLNSNVAKTVGLNCNNNYITSNRLTLAIFPKAVRSETITRPLLAEIRHEPGNININNIVKSKRSVHSENTNNTFEEEENVHSLNLSKNGTNIFSAEEESDGIPNNNRLDSEIFRLDSSGDVGRGAGSSSARSAAASPGRSPSPPPSAGPVARLRDRHAYRMYEQFVKNIPTFIQIHAPALLTGDAMKKPKATLHSMYVEGRRRRAEAERPPASLASPAARAKRGRPAPRRSPEPDPRSPRSPSSPPPRSETSTRDTPEYTYFPHKLNQ